MRREGWRTSGVLALALALFASACTSSGDPRKSPTPSVEVVAGGTLRLATPGLDAGEWFGFGGLDPQRDYSFAGWELFRCCLLRTLVSYNGTPTDQGGAELRPDLAEALPEVSSDGLTWTFRLRSGIHYAPPLEDTQIIAADLIRALEREATPVGAEGYAFYYSVIRGFDEYATGEAASISGLETPDERTLVVRLHEPASDLAYRFSLPATAPIPPDAAEGHDKDYGPFLVASGPYMIEGAEDLDPTLPSEQQQPLSGFVPPAMEGDAIVEPGSLALVRNPSWESATDDLRPAHPDRIEIVLGGDRDELDAAVENGDLDMVFGITATAEQVDRYQDDPALAGLAYVHPSDSMFFVSMNLAVPPFDDVHVRRAMNFGIDKAPLARLVARPVFAPFGHSVALAATHLAPDSLEGNLLFGFDPYPHDLDDARAEMRLSAYDGDGDGRCDAPVCREVQALVIDRPGLLWGRSIERDLAAIGIGLNIDVEPADRFFARLRDPTERIPLGIAPGWAADYPSASTWFPYQFASEMIGNDFASSYSLVGATPEQLEDWGYSVASVPNVDERIDRCESLLGSPQIECWAAFDQYLMTEVVPWVPFVTLAHAQLVSERVVGYSFDQFATLPALDRIQLAPGSS